MLTRLLGETRVRALWAFLTWEFSREWTRGWTYLVTVIGYSLGAVVLLSLGDLFPRSYVDILLPGLVVLALLYPLLRLGDGFVTPEGIPRKFRASPIPRMLLLFRGFTGRLAQELMGLMFFVAILGFGGVNLTFLTSGVFWLLLVVAVPSSLGIACLLTVLQLVTGDGGTLRGVMDWILILLGGVFLNPAQLPYGLGWIGYAVPLHAPTAYARGWLTAPWLWASGTLLLGALILVVGVWGFGIVQDQMTRNGTFHRVT